MASVRAHVMGFQAWGGLAMTIFLFGTLIDAAGGVKTAKMRAKLPSSITFTIVESPKKSESARRRKFSWERSPKVVEIHYRTHVAWEWWPFGMVPCA